jgi:hypothetical protein
MDNVQKHDIFIKHRCWNIQCDSKLLSGFPSPIMKLLMEYRNVTQNVLLLVESILQNAEQLQHAQFYFVFFGLKIIGDGSPDNN